jgi:hypothetical protein
MELTAERLRELLDYDPETGVFRWKMNRRRGKVAGTLRPDGYRQIGIDGCLYLEHRLAWLYVNGEWPADEIDHRNRERAGNQVESLRPATRPQNFANSIGKGSTSGFKGVSAYGQKWRARICVEGNHIFLGYFDTVDDARAAYWQAAQKYCGEFARAA